MATQTQINTLTGLYVGYFDRSPDPAGLDFWIGQLDDGRDIRTIAQDFAKSKEAEFLYPYLTNPSSSSAQIFLSTIYENLFNRAPDEAGLKFWSDVLGNGSVSAGDMIEAVLNGAVGDDATIVNNKIEVAYDWTTSVSLKSDFIYDEDAASAAKAAIANVTEITASVTAAKEQTDTYVAGTTEEPASEPTPAPGGGGTPAPAPKGKIFTLTTEDDAVVGTPGDDKFIGVQSGVSVDATFNAGDSIDGQGGENTLQLVNRTDTDVHKAAVTNVSNMIYTSANLAGGDLDLADFASITNLTLKNTVGFSDVAGVATSEILTIETSDNTMDTTVTYAGVAGTTDAAAISLNGIQGGSDLQLSGAVETVTLATSGSDSALADLDLDAATTTLNIAADENLTIEDQFTATGLTKLAVSGDSVVRIKPTLDAATVTVDASAMTAGGLKVKLGSGDVKVTGGAGKDVVDMGAGLTANDELVGGEHEEDTLAVSGPVTADDVSKVTGFEYLSFTANVTQDVNLVSPAGFKGFISSGNTNATFNNVDNDMLIVAVEKSSGTINVTPTADTGMEVLNIWLWNSDLTALTASGFETVNLSSYGNFGGTATHVITTLNIDAGAKVFLDGGTDLTITDALAVPSTVDASSGFSGKLSVIGSTGSDVIKGGTADDAINGGGGDDELSGGAGNDRFEFAAGEFDDADQVVGGSGTDTIALGDEGLTADQYIELNSYADVEVLEFTASGADTGIFVDVGKLQEISKFKFSGASISGAAGPRQSPVSDNGVTPIYIIQNDDDEYTISGTVTGGAGANVTSGQAGHGAAAMGILGGTSASVMLAGGATIAGGAGGDSANGAGGIGGAGIDARELTTLAITSEGGSLNTIVGGSGGTGAPSGYAAPSVILKDADAISTITVTGDTDLNLGQITSVNADGRTDIGTGVTNVEASSFTGNLTVTGNQKTNIITGGSGNDALNGAGGDDTLNGGMSNDTLTGGTGADVMSGGPGTDTFVFAGAADSSATVTDQITDFVGGTDKVKFVNSASFEIVAHSSITEAADLAAATAAAFARAATGTDAGLEALQFAYGANTYFAVEATATGDALDAVVVDVTGLSGTVTAADFVA